MSSTTAPSPQQQARFAALLPIVQRHARIQFRNLRGQEQDDKLQETRAIAWKQFKRLEERGKDVFRFPTVFAVRCAQAARNGRRICGMDKATDALSPVAHRKHGFRVESLPQSCAEPHETINQPFGQRAMDAWEERLHEHAQSPVPEQVAMRVDFPAWLRTWDELHRRIISAMAQDERTKDLARRFGKSQGRISQLRTEYRTDWERFTE